MIVGLSLSRGGRRRDDDARQGHRAVGRCRRGVASVALLTPSKHLVSTQLFVRYYYVKHILHFIGIGS